MRVQSERVLSLFRFESQAGDEEQHAVRPGCV